MFSQFCSKYWLEPLADREVNKEIGRAVDGQEQVADVDEDEEPAWSKATVTRVKLIESVAQNVLSKIEAESWGVGYEVHYHYY